MMFSFLMCVIVTSLTLTNGIDLNSILGRLNCYPHKQLNCNERLIDKYKNVSRSVTNLTDADTWFFLFTRRNRAVPEKLHDCGGNLPPNSNFNPNNELIIIFLPLSLGVCDVAVYREWKEQFLDRGDYNVLLTDYSWGHRIDYSTAALNAKIVAQQTAIVIRNIQGNFEVPLSNKIHVIGFSLGGQIAGMLGNMIHVRRITGLDPAGPAFVESTPLPDRLDRSDADFVDVWHCNAGDCLPNLGINYDAGHVDFYINGGTYQFACYTGVLRSVLVGDFLSLGSTLLPTGCFHFQCSQYYKMMINPDGCQYVGVECENKEDFNAGRCNSCGSNGEKCALMSLDVEKYFNKSTAPKRYYVKTTLFCDFCDNSDLKLEGFADVYNSVVKNNRNEGPGFLFVK